MKKELTLKHTIAVLSCSAALVAGLTACGSADDTSPLPQPTASSSPSTPATTRPTTIRPTATATATGPVALAARSSYDYNGMTLVVNLPADIPAASQPRMRLFSEFLQADGRTTAANKLDPEVARLASADIVKDVKSTTTRPTTGEESVQRVGTLTYTISTIHTCQTVALPRSLAASTRASSFRSAKNGTQFDDNGDNNSTLKMAATIERGPAGLKVTRFAFATGPC